MVVLPREIGICVWIKPLNWVGHDILRGTLGTLFIDMHISENMILKLICGDGKLPKKFATALPRWPGHARACRCNPSALPWFTAPPLASHVDKRCPCWKRSPFSSLGDIGGMSVGCVEYFQSTLFMMCLHVCKNCCRLFWKICFFEEVLGGFCATFCINWHVWCEFCRIGFGGCWKIMEDLDFTPFFGGSVFVWGLNTWWVNTAAGLTVMWKLGVICLPFWSDKLCTWASVPSGKLT